MSRHRVRLGPAYFLPHLFLAALSGVGVLLLLTAKTGWETFVGVVIVTILSIPLLYMLIRTVPTWGEVLTIFENGFSYRSGRGLQTCRWDQIEDVTEILDLGKRLKMTSAFKTGGEKIIFAYRMGGLDVLSYEYHVFVAERENGGSIEDEPEPPAERVFGDVTGTYRIRFGLAYFLPIGALLFLAVFGVLVFVASRDVVSIFICAVPAIIPVLLLTRTAFLDRRDELTVFENGFAYRHRGETVDCLWTEIEDYQTTRREASLTAIKKQDGEWVHFANEMQGLSELMPHVRIVVKWTGPES